MKVPHVKRCLSRICKKRGREKRATWAKRTENSWCKVPGVEAGWVVMQEELAAGSESCSPTSSATMEPTSTPMHTTDILTFIFL